MQPASSSLPTKPCGASAARLLAVLIALAPMGAAGQESGSPAPGSSTQEQEAPAAPDQALPGAVPPAIPNPSPPRAAPAPAPAVTPRSGEVLLNFQAADLQAVVKAVSQMTGRNLLVDPRVRGQFTIVSARPMPVAAA